MTRWLSQLFPWLAWLFSSALTLLSAAILRTTVVAIAGAIKRSVAARSAPEAGRILRWSVAAVDNFAIFGLAALGLGAVLAFEYIYRKAHEQGKLWKRFGLVTGVQAALLVACSMTLSVIRALGAG